jgi:hypothetical protein
MKRNCNSILDKEFFEVTSECMNENISSDEDTNFKTEEENSKEESKPMCT